MTIERALKAISDCYYNTQYTLEEALDNMEALVEAAQENIEALNEDIIAEQ